MNSVLFVRMHHVIRHAFLYALIALLGSLSLFSVSSVSIGTDLYEATVSSRPYQVDEVDVRSQKIDDDSSFDQQAKKWKPVTISWLPVSLVSLYIYNHDTDVTYIPSNESVEVISRDHFLIPLGNQAPPAIL